MNFTLSFDSNFFESLRSKWLTTKEIYLLLKSIDELLDNSDISLSSSPQPNKNINYYFTKFSDCKNFSNQAEFEKESSFNLKINGINKIHCYYSSSLFTQRRVYHLIDNPKYCFIHFLPIERKKNKPQCKNDIHSDYPIIKIVDFSPNKILETETNAKILIVIETYLSIKELNQLCPFIKILFGNIAVSCNIVAPNVLSCNIPKQNETEVIIDIYMSSQEDNTVIKKISYYDDNSNKKSFKYVSLHKPNVIFSNTFKNNCSKIKCPIFSYSEHDLQAKILSLIKHMLSHIEFYSNTIINHENTNNKIQIIDITFLVQNFTEENLNFVISKIANELNKINKLYLIDFVDNCGYNLLHYICAINYCQTLQLLNKLKINLEYKSKDDLSCYEICAGRRNLESLTTLIDITDSIENENEEKFLYNVDILKSALNISLEGKNIDRNDLNVLDLLIKQIKIKYTVDATSGKIINDMTNKVNSDISIDENQEKSFDSSKVYINNNIQKLQGSVRGWLRRNKYKSLKKAANRLIDKFKNYSERKKYRDMRHSTILIQHQIRSWLNQKHEKTKKKK